LPFSLTGGITDAFGSVDKVPSNLTEIGTGGLVNPFKTFGNINIKETFDSLGNPVKEIIKKGVPSIVPRFDSKAEAAPPIINITFPTDQTTLNLPKIFESHASIRGGSIKVDNILKDINVKKEPKTAEQRGAQLLGTLQSGTGEESKQTGGQLGGGDLRGGNRTSVFYAKTPEPEGDREKLPAFADAMLESLGAFSG